MCSKNDSNATYCSEVEDLIKDGNARQKFSANIPLRRSQRLSQKIKEEKMCSWDNVRITKLANIIEKKKYKVIPSHRLRASKLSQDIFSSEDLREDQEIVFPALKRQLNDICVNDQMNCQRKYVNLLRTKEEDVPLDLCNKSKVLTRKTSEGELNVSKDANKLKIKGELKTIKTIPKGKRKPFTTKKLEKFSRIKNERYVTQTKSDIHKIPTSKDIKLKSFKRSQTTSDSNKNVQISQENSSGLSSKKIKLSNENIVLNESQNQKELPQNCLNESKSAKRLSKTSITLKNKMILEENNLKTNVFLNQTKLNTVQKLSRHVLKKTPNEKQIIKRSQNRKLSVYKDKKSGENTSKLIILSKELPHIKSEPLVSLEINSKFSSDTKLNNKIQKSKESLNNNNKITENINKLTNNPSQDISQKSSTLRANVIKNHKSSQTNLNKNEINYKNIKTEPSSNNTKQVKCTQENYSAKRCKKLLQDPPLESIISHTTSSDKVTAPKMFNKIPDKNTNYQTETNDKPKIKNIMKNFDRTLYLDKIQSLTKYTENSTSQNANFGINNLTPSESTQDLLRKSLLPDVYPPHFKYQLPPEAALSTSLHLQIPQTYVTPDDTVNTELLESSSSSPSLPESLCELLQTKDIKEILNVEKVSYRLYNYHVQALALILNVRLEYLQKILDKITKIKPEILINIDKAVNKPFVPDYDLFAMSPDDMATSSEMVFNSQSPKQRRISSFSE